MIDWLDSGPYNSPSIPAYLLYLELQTVPTADWASVNEIAVPQDSNPSEPSLVWMNRLGQSVPFHTGYATLAWRNINRRRALVLFLLVVIFIMLPPFRRRPQAFSVEDERLRLRANELTPVSTSSPDPRRWLELNSDKKYAIGDGKASFFRGMGYSSRPRAALISLVRNSELEGMIQSMRQLEYRWNRKYQYPWVFFNDEPFTAEFKAATSNLTSAECHYEVIPREQWSIPNWIDQDRFMSSLEYMGAIGVGKGWMVSYRHMCRWNSGFFYKHPRLKEFDWYWRVEPDVHYLCDIDYDVFRLMRDNNLKYGFNMNILDDARSFPSLWRTTQDFMNENPELIHPEADLSWLVDMTNIGEYNNCQFFSNFEIGDLNFFRAKPNEAYFNWLDRAGGFFYERLGDAPLHTLSVAMFLPKKHVWFFQDIGYQHDINRHCPPNLPDRCACEPTSLDENFDKLVPSESPQRKPDDTCIRRFLGGKWLKKKDGWSREAEQLARGDGYERAEKDGLWTLALGAGRLRSR